jgi:mRNA interferase MazF
VKRGEIWTAAGGGDYTGKPRPVVIIQDDRFDATSSVTVCPCTGEAVEAPLFRVRVEPTEENGLDAVTYLMADKVTTVRRQRLGSRLGSLTDADVLRLEQALLVFLGFA